MLELSRDCWPIPGREGWFLEVGPVPDRKSPYLIVVSPYGMRSAAQFLGVAEAAEVQNLLDWCLKPGDGSS